MRQNCARSPGAQFGSKGNCNILLFDEVMGQNLSGGGHRGSSFPWRLCVFQVRQKIILSCMKPLSAPYCVNIVHTRKLILSFLKIFGSCLLYVGTQYAYLR